MGTLVLMTDWDDSADMTAANADKELFLNEAIMRLNLDLANATTQEEQDNINEQLNAAEADLEKHQAGEFVDMELAGYDVDERGLKPFTPK